MSNSASYLPLIQSIVVQPFISSARAVTAIQAVRRSKGFVVTTKEKVIALIQALDDNVTLDDVIDRLYLLRKIELGIAQANAGDVMEHDAFMDELEVEDAH